jgi:Protein of unknown function (DUF2868)
MNEAAARETVLVRAIETTDAGRAVWSDADRAWATRAAAEITGADAAPDVFVARRASLVLERLRTRHPAFARALRMVTWRSWIAPVLVVAAFALGVAADQLGPAQRVNVLAFPLLALLAWNVVLYALIAVRGVWGLVSPRGRALGPLAGAVARLGRLTPREVAVPDAAVSTVLAVFFAEWGRATAPLAAARVARCLHWAAFALALGAIAGMYVRGLVLEYRAGWESTFIDAETVHALLAFVLGPAAALTGIPIADVPRLEAMRFGAGGAGENAAPWIHLYATTVALVVLVPRCLLGLGTWLADRRLAAQFPLVLDEPYFARLTRRLGREPARVRIVPYSYQLAPQAVLGLQAIAARLFGPHAEVSVAPGISWGGEDALPDGLVPAVPHALVAIVFSLTATPEPDNHGAFLAAVATLAGRAAPVVAIVDESGFRKRFAHEPQRLDERRAAWRDLLAARGREPIFVDLESPDAAAADAAIERCLQPEARA